MKEPDLKKIRKAMEKELDPKRYEHTLGVAYTAASLAMRYGADLNSALIAGMLHDCAKCLSNEKKISICKKHDIPINPAEEKNPFLLHAKVGSYLASKKYGVTDPDILNAILNQRSQDMLAANNWNVVQYAVLTMMLAQVSGFEPGEFVHVIADAHIYDRHVPAIERIIENEPKSAPKFIIDPSVDDFYKFTRDSFRMENYEFTPFDEKIPVAL